MVEILLTEHALAVIVSPVTMATIFFALPYLSADKSTCVTLSIVKRFFYMIQQLNLIFCYAIYT